MTDEELEWLEDWEDDEPKELSIHGNKRQDKLIHINRKR